MCPRCRSDHISRSRRWKFVDLFMRLWGMRPYRCRECHSRFYMPSKLAFKIASERSWVHHVESGSEIHSRRVRR